MENTHPLSLATGTLPEFSPPEVVDAAAQAAYWGCGVWFDAETWTDQTTKDTKKAFQESGLVPLDIEVIWIQPTGWDDNFERLLDAGAEIGVRNALIVSSEPDMAATSDQFGRLCDLAQERNIFACLEFLPITEVKSLDDALKVLEMTGHDNGKLLIDPLHLARTGGTPGDIAKKVDPKLLTYAQLCDARRDMPGDGSIERILQEAVDGRLSAGEGQLPLDELMQVLPDDLPLALEVRSKPLRETYESAAWRARVVLVAAQEFLEGVRGL